MISSPERISCRTGEVSQRSPTMHAVHRSGSRLVERGRIRDFRIITHFVDNHDGGNLTKTGLRFREEDGYYGITE
jgi:hypothetical protein